MMYQSFLPSLPLQDVVRNYTLIHFQFRAHAPIPPKQRSPKPEEKLVFYIKGSVNLIDPTTGRIEKPPRTSIYGHQREARVFQVTSEFDTLVVYLRPGVLHRLTRIPAIELSGQVCDAALIFGREMDDLISQLIDNIDPLVRIQIVERFLLEKCRCLKAKNSIDRVAEHLLASPSTFSLETLADDACLSSKQFYRRFNEQIGMNPKLFSRLSRFNHAYRFKLTHPEVSWSSVAQEFRYTDYHHLEKEFKEFSGQTPTAWVQTHLGSPERILKLR